MADTADTPGARQDPPTEAAPGDPSPTAPNPHRAKHKRRHRVRLAVLIIGALLVVALLADLILTAGKVHPRVTAGGIAIGGDTLEQAQDALTTEAERLASTELTFHAGERSLPTTPASLGWRPDPAATAQAAFDVGRDGPTGLVTGRLGSWLFGTDIPWVDRWDRKVVRTTVAGWSDVVSLPIQEGSVTIQKGDVVVTEPKAGTKIDTEALVQRIEAAMAEGTTDLDVPLVQAAPISTSRSCKRRRSRRPRR